VGQLVGRDLLGIGADVVGFEVDLLPAAHPAGGALATDEVVGQPVARDRPLVELGLQVLQVQREVEDRGVTGAAFVLDGPAAGDGRPGAQVGGTRETFRNRRRSAPFWALLLIALRMNEGLNTVRFSLP
jgi:hypothetical protein